jgi:acetylornithine deacetylase/succinyl-diaminopimelate desuccinylase-like protein
MIVVGSSPSQEIIVSSAETLAQIDAYIESHMDSTIDALRRLVAQPSVAAQNLGIVECSQLVAEMLRERGHTADIMPSDGNPVVVGRTQGQGDKTLMFYLHYDVQPAEPFELWDSPPWELTQRDGKLFGRGSGDDKGHIITRLAAVEAVRAVMGELPCQLKWVIEGEEEIGSVHLPPFIEQHKDLLAADACVWEFGAIDHNDAPIQYLGMRGICYVELSVQKLNRDAHSGMVGSILANAAWRLVWALNTLKDQNEHILIPGHYDSVVGPSPRDLELLEKLPDQSAEILATFEAEGFLNGMVGGPDLRRQEVFVPTCTIAGLTSGYQGPGSKTIVPAAASAKVDFRLVPDQTPEEVLSNLRKHLDANGFDDIEITYLGGGRPAQTDFDHPFIQLVLDTAEETYGKASVVSPMVGGSGPNYPFVHVLGLPVAMAGISYPHGAAHSPNEHIRIDDFVKGIKHTARIIEAYGRMEA